MQDAAPMAETIAALTYMAAGGVALAFGTAVLLYERFSSASRRFAVLAAVVAAWFATLVATRWSVDPASVGFWWGATAAFQALTAPAVYGLATHLTGSPRRRRVRAAWLVGFGWFGWSLLRPEVSLGVGAVFRGDYLSPEGVVGMGLVLFVTGLLGAAIAELLAGFRHSASERDRRRHLVMLIAMGVGAVSVVDYFVVVPWLGVVGVSTLAIPAAVAVMALGQVRYRAFADHAGFASVDVLRALGDAVLVCDEVGTIRIVNPEAVRLMGGAAGVAVGRSIHEFLEPGDGVQDRPSSAPPEPYPWPASVRDREMRLRPLAGEPIPVSVSAEPLRGVGVPRGHVIVARDLRDRLASQQALEASELRYRSLFWHNPGLAYEVAADGTLLSLNPAAEKLLGVERPGQLVGRRFADFLAPDDLAPIHEIFQSVLGGVAREYEIELTTLRGDRKVVRGVGIPIVVGGEVTGGFGVGLDVTEETRAKRELEVQRRYFAELFESSPEAIALVSETGEVQRVNGEFSRLFGYTRDEAVGRKLKDLIVPEEDRPAADRLGRRAADGHFMQAELVRRTRDGRSVDVSLLARRIDVPGEEVQIYANYRDVSDQKRTEAKLRQREDELRHTQRLEALGKLAGGIAHDFNNLLTVINGHARFALDELAADHQVRPDLEEIDRAGDRAASLTQQLLAFSRRQVMRPQSLDLNAVVRDMDRMLRRLIGAHIRLDIDLAPALPLVLADRGQVEQVVMNLLVNGRDAMSDGGTLTVRTHVVDLEAGSARSARWELEPGAYVRLDVEDTGAGMTPEVLARAFDPFFTTKERGKGTGLGLSTVFGIVKQSGGHVTAESEPGRGSRFHVYLPAARITGAVPRAVEDAPLVDPVTSGTILVAEDEPAVRSLTVRILGRNGYTVLEAADGAEALRVAASFDGPIHLLLTDLVMPEMGGRELASRLRETRPDTPVLFMSGYDDELSATGLDGDAFLAKPFAPGELIELAGALTSGAYP